MAVLRDEVRHDMMAHLVGGVADARKRFDAATGRFLAQNGGWAVTQQDIIYPLALIYVTESDANPLRGDAETLELASRGGDALRDWQDEDGRVEFIKVDGSRWGKTYMPWSMYHWLEAFALLRDHLSAERRASWEKGLRLCFTGSARQHEHLARTHNIPTWHAMALVRASQVFDKPHWREVGERIIRTVVAAQHPDGYWPEGRGPTTGYNRVYVHAIGLYHHFTHDESVVPCLERALGFHLHFTYPDGTAVETVDGRTRGRPSVHPSALPGFSIFPAGRRFVRFLVQKMRQARPEGELIPHLASGLEHLPDGPEEPIPQEEPAYAAIHGGHALVRRAGPWFYCMSGYTTPTEALPENWAARWRLDRQNYLSVWHDDAGLIVHGGNSKNQPEFSTFYVIDGRTRWLQADEAQLIRDDANGDVLRLKYGDVQCELRVHVTAENRIDLIFRSSSGSAAARVTAGLSVKVKAGSRLSASTGPEVFEADPQRTWGAGWDAEDASSERWVRGDGWRLDAPPGSKFTWPVYPFNPYAVNNASPPEAAVAVLTTALLPGGEAKRITISAGTGAE